MKRNKGISLPLSPTSSSFASSSSSSSSSNKQRKKRKMSLRTRENKHMWIQELDETMVKICLELNSGKKKNSAWKNIDIWKTATNKLNTSIHLSSYSPMEVDDLGRRLYELNNENKSAPKSSIQELVTDLFYHMEFSVPKFLLSSKRDRSRSPMRTTSRTTTTAGTFDTAESVNDVNFTAQMESVNDVSDPLAEFMQNLHRMNVEQDTLFELVEKTPPHQKKIFNQCPSMLKNGYLQKLQRDHGKR